MLHADGHAVRRLPYERRRELRAQLDSQLNDSQKRLTAAEKARDAAIAAVEQAARGRTPRRGPSAGGRWPWTSGARAAVLAGEPRCGSGRDEQQLIGARACM